MTIPRRARPCCRHRRLVVVGRCRRHQRRPPSGRRPIAQRMHRRVRPRLLCCALGFWPSRRQRPTPPTGADRFQFRGEGGRAPRTASEHILLSRFSPPLYWEWRLRAPPGRSRPAASSPRGCYRYACREAAAVFRASGCSRRWRLSPTPARDLDASSRSATPSSERLVRPMRRRQLWARTPPARSCMQPLPATRLSLGALARRCLPACSDAALCTAVRCAGAVNVSGCRGCERNKHMGGNYSDSASRRCVPVLAVAADGGRARTAI